MTASVEGLGMSGTLHLHTYCCQGPYTTSRFSGEEFGFSGKGGIQTEEDRAGCGCEDIVKAGYECASRELC